MRSYQKILNLCKIFEIRTDYQNLWCLIIKRKKGRNLSDSNDIKKAIFLKYNLYVIVRTMLRTIALRKWNVNKLLTLFSFYTRPFSCWVLRIPDFYYHWNVGPFFNTWAKSVHSLKERLCYSLNNFQELQGRFWHTIQHVISQYCEQNEDNESVSTIKKCKNWSNFFNKSLFCHSWKINICTSRYLFVHDLTFKLHVTPQPE